MRYEIDMKHINEYMNEIIRPYNQAVTESIFDKPATDGEIIADELKKIFAKNSPSELEFNVNGNVLEIKCNGTFSFDNNILKDTRPLLSGINELHVPDVISHIYDVPDISKQFPTIETGYLYIDQCKMLNGCKLIATNRMTIERTDIIRSELIVDHAWSEKDKLHIRFVGSSLKDLHLMLRDVKTNTPYIYINKYSGWDITCKSPELEAVDIDFNDTGLTDASMYDSDMYAVLQDLTNLKRPNEKAVEKFLDQNSERFKTIDPSTDFHISAPKLSMIRIELYVAGHFIYLVLFGPKSSPATSNLYIKHRRKAYKLYEMANGWSLGYEL